MAGTPVSSASATNTTAATTVTAPVTHNGIVAGNTVVLMVGAHYGNTGAIDAPSSSPTETWTAINTEVSDALANSYKLFEAHNVAGGNYTITGGATGVGGTVSGVSCITVELSGILTSGPLDQSAQGHSAATATSQSATTGTTTQAQETVVCLCGWGAASNATFAAGSGFTQYGPTTQGATAMGMTFEYANVAATGAQTGSFTMGTAANLSIVVGTLKETTGPPPQTVYPTSDVSTGSWTTDTGATTNLYQAIDETSANDADYDRSPLAPSSATLEVALGDPTDPASSTGHIVHYRYLKDADGPIDLTVALYQGGTSIASWTHTGIGAAVLQADQTLSGAQADSITDYTDLRLRFTANQTPPAGSTQYFLRDAASDINPGAELEKLASRSRGAASATKVTTTTASGTNIQATDSAGGTALCWFTPPLQGVTISGTVTVNLRGREAANTVNAGRGILIERTNGSGIVQSAIVPDTAHGTEFTTSDAANAAWTITPTSTTLADGDRIKITVKVRNVGTMASNASGVTYSIDGPTAAAAGDSYVTFADSIAEQARARVTWANLEVPAAPAAGKAPPIYLVRDPMVAQRLWG